jgi:glycosyltransferase involved in cell wall biosynthesis
MSEVIELSVVVPVYNEEESLPLLHAEIGRALEELDLDPSQAEIVYVDDCSLDRSLRVMLEQRRTDPRVRIVKFRRNFGQTAALAAGFDLARGRVVVTLDGDLQNDPADIPRLLERLGQGYDIVAGWRRRRHDGFVLRRLPSLLANRLIAFSTGVRIHDTGCTLKAFRRALVKNMSIYAEQHRFLPVLCAASGGRVCELEVNHRPRRFGRSKYGLGRATRVALDLLTIKLISQFSHRPLQYFGLLALGALLLGLGFAVVGLVGVTGVLGESLAVGGEGVSEMFVLNDWEMAIVTILLLLFSLVVYFALLGLLGELAVKASGMHRRSTLDRILNELH